MWQTVPDSRGGNRESSVAVRRQPRTAHNQRQLLQCNLLTLCRLSENISDELAIVHGLICVVFSVVKMFIFVVFLNI